VVHPSPPEDPVRTMRPMTHPTASSSPPLASGRVGFGHAALSEVSLRLQVGFRVEPGDRHVGPCSGSRGLGRCTRGGGSRRGSPCAAPPKGGPPSGPIHRRKPHSLSAPARGVSGIGGNRSAGSLARHRKHERARGRRGCRYGPGTGATTGVAGRCAISAPDPRSPSSNGGRPVST